MNMKIKFQKAMNTQPTWRVDWVVEPGEHRSRYHRAFPPVCMQDFYGNHSSETLHSFVNPRLQVELPVHQCKGRRPIRKIYKDMNFSMPISAPCMKILNYHLQQFRNQIWTRWKLLVSVIVKGFDWGLWTRSKTFHLASEVSRSIVQYRGSKSHRVYY